MAQVYDVETIFQISHDLRKRGKTVGFTHGAFDLFHTGHAYFLNESAKHCDFLFVGVESDRSIKKYKDPNRPIIDEKDRSNLVGNIIIEGGIFVNTVFELGGNYIDLYKEIKPEFISIGRRFSNEDIVIEEIKKSGSRVEKFDQDLGEETTRIIKRIREKKRA